MPRVRIKHQRFKLQSKYVLMIMSGVCLFLMVLTYTTDIVSGPLSYISGYTIVPFQNGISQVGSYLSSRADDLKNLKVVTEKNRELQEEVDRLKIENSNLIQDKYELNMLREMYDLDQKYAGYEKTAARVISKDPGNWFSVFLIDKGSKDGIEKDMNVMSGAGLVGIVTQVGENWSTVRSIIDDSSNVSAQVMTTSDHMVVTGNLLLMEQNRIAFSQLLDSDDMVSVGDQIVTSDISDKYLPGIIIGYVSSVEKDSNNLTKSGTLTPVVDFGHLSVVLVIKELKTVD